MNRSAHTTLVISTLLAALPSLLATEVAALPLISEVYYDAVGSDDGQSFVELYGAPGSLLDGLFLEGVNGSNGAVTHTIALVGTIPADGLFVLADVDSAGLSLVAEADGFANFDFQNGPDSVLLRDDTTVLDAVGYGVFTGSEVFAGEGSPAEDPAAGSSLARWFADEDTDDNGVDFTVLGVPTPGLAELSVPEPGTGTLMASALAVVLCCGGRGRSRRGRRAGIESPEGFCVEVQQVT